jgi:ribosomal protein L29
MAKKTENFKEMNKDELKTKLAELREALRVFKFKTEGSKSKNVKEAGNLKKQIAKVLTEVNKK